MRKIGITFPIFASLLSLVAAHSRSGNYDSHMGGGIMGMYGPAWGVFLGILIGVMMVALILFIIWVIKQMGVRK